MRKEPPQNKVFGRQDACPKNKVFGRQDACPTRFFEMSNV
jgi:hypothetical protein